MEQSKIIDTLETYHTHIPCGLPPLKRPTRTSRWSIKCRNLWIQKVAAVELGFWLRGWSFGGTQVYIGGSSTSVEQRGPHEGGGRAWGVGAPHTSCLPGWCLDVGSKSSGSSSFRKSRSQRFYFVWTLFDIIFLRYPKIGKKTTILGWASD